MELGHVSVGRWGDVPETVAVGPPGYRSLTGTTATTLWLARRDRLRSGLESQPGHTGVTRFDLTVHR
ncbi:MAG: hypothetical protein A07HR60_02483 [uncultured archaeon A07HR60]|nr:MAG: hypothetical protein A07HR60_02483 [uncultured archaeon A07HR60]